VVTHSPPTASPDPWCLRRDGASGFRAALAALGISVSLRARSGGDGLLDVDQPTWRNRPTVGQEFARVVEDDDAVAQQAPPLLGVEGDGVSRVTVGTVS